MSSLLWTHAVVAMLVLAGLSLSPVMRRADVVFWHRAWSGVAVAAVAVFGPAALHSVWHAASTQSRLVQAAALVYVAGTLLLVVRLVAGLLLVRRLAARGQPLAGPWLVRLRAIVGDDADRCRVHGRVQVPIAIGGRDPIVLLPEIWVRWHDDRVRAVVRHELAHLDRRDFGWNLAAALFEACFWPNPLARVLTQRMRLLAECACDRRAADHVGAETYMQVLLASARGAGERGAHARLLVPGSATDIEARIAALLS